RTRLHSGHLDAGVRCRVHWLRRRRGFGNSPGRLRRGPGEVKGWGHPLSHRAVEGIPVRSERSFVAGAYGIQLPLRGAPLEGDRVHRNRLATLIDGKALARELAVRSTGDLEDDTQCTR